MAEDDIDFPPAPAVHSSTVLRITRLNAFHQFCCEDQSPSRLSDQLEVQKQEAA